MKLNKRIIIFILIFIVLSSYFVSAELIEIDVSFNSSKVGDIQRIEIIPIVDSGYAVSAMDSTENITCTDNNGVICGNEEGFFVKIINWFKGLFK